MNSEFSVFIIILYTIIITTFVLLQMYWIVKLIKAAYKLICERKEEIRNTWPFPNEIILFRLRYNFRTQLAKHFFLLAIIGVELFTLVYISSSLAWFNAQVRKWDRVVNGSVNISENCTVYSHLGYLFYFPFPRILFSIQAICFNTLIILLSALTTYLSRRYFIHPFSLSMYKYTVWWCFQVILFLFCCPIQSFVLAFFIAPVVFLINWLYLVKEMRNFSSILLAHSKDILNYHYDRNHYVTCLKAYTNFKIFSLIIIISFFLALISFFFYIIQFLVPVFLECPCYLEVVYKIQLPFYHFDERFVNEVKHLLAINDDYISPIMDNIMAYFTIIPVCLYTIAHIALRHLRKRNTPIRYTPIYSEFGNGISGKPLLKAHRRRNYILCCV